MTKRTTNNPDVAEDNVNLQEISLEKPKGGPRPKRLRSTLERRAVTFLILLIAVLSFSLTYIFFASAAKMLADELKIRGDSIATSIAQSATLGILLEDDVILQDVTAPFLNEFDIEYIWILDSKGKLLFPNASTLTSTALPDVTFAGVIKAPRAVSDFSNKGEIIKGQASFDGYHIAIPVWRRASGALLGDELEKIAAPDVTETSEREFVGIVQVGLARGRTDARLLSMMLGSGLLVLGVGVVGAFLAATLLHRWLEPLQAVTSMAKIIREAGYSDSISRIANFVRSTSGSSSRVLDRRDEIGQLHQTFTEMLEALGAHDQKMQSQKQQLERMVVEQTEELIRARDVAEDANKAKSTFFTSMSHEIRTSLNSVIGFTQMLQKKYAVTSDEKRNEYLEIIRSNSQHLLSLINDIVDLSKLEAGQYELTLFMFYLSPCIHDAVAFNRTALAKKNIECMVQCPDIVVTNDERILKQVIINIISNAVKFTPQNGRIEVVVQHLGACLSVKITDNGRGMTGKEVRKALKPFVQVIDPENIKDTQSTGLGLPLVDHFVERMGGKMQIKSEKDKGTSVCIELPLVVHTRHQRNIL